MRESGAKLWLLLVIVASCMISVISCITKPVRFAFASRKLQLLYATGHGRYPAEVIRAFFRVMGHIDQATDERDLYALKSLRYESLKGDRKGQHSLRLNDRWRLIVERVDDAVGRMLRIVEIVDYH